MQFLIVFACSCVFPSSVSTPGVCKQEVEWAKQTGIQQHPEWYPGLSAQSSLVACTCIYEYNETMCCTNEESRRVYDEQ